MHVPSSSLRTAAGETGHISCWGLTAKMAWAKYAGASGSPVTTASQEDTKTIPVMPSELLEGVRPVAISQRLSTLVGEQRQPGGEHLCQHGRGGRAGSRDRHAFEPLDMSHIASCQGPVLAGTCRNSFASVQWCSSLCSQQVCRVSLLAPLAFKKTGWELGRCSASKVTCCANRNT